MPPRSVAEAPGSTDRCSYTPIRAWVKPICFRDWKLLHQPVSGQSRAYVSSEEFTNMFIRDEDAGRSQLQGYFQVGGHPAH